MPNLQRRHLWDFIDITVCETMTYIIHYLILQSHCNMCFGKLSPLGQASFQRYRKKYVKDFDHLTSKIEILQLVSRFITDTHKYKVSSPARISLSLQKSVNCDLLLLVHALSRLLLLIVNFCVTLEMVWMSLFSFNLDFNHAPIAPT